MNIRFVIALLLITLNRAALAQDSQQSQPQIPPAAAPPPAESQAAAQAPSVQEPSYNNEFHYLDPSTGNLTILEKVSLEMNAKVRAMGFGGAKQTLQAAGAASGVRFKADAPLAFVVRGVPPNMNPEDWISLLRFEIKKDHREILMASAGFGGMGGKSRGGDEGKLPFSVTKYGKDSLKIAPTRPLEQGEYVLTTNIFGRGFCFGIDPVQAKQ